jgi:hypothetical protein
MAFPIGRILMAYRPLYLRGLLMDGQYKLPATQQPAPVPPEPRGSKEVTTQRVLAAPRKPLHGITT